MADRGYVQPSSHYKTQDLPSSRCCGGDLVRLTEHEANERRGFNIILTPFHKTLQSIRKAYQHDYKRLIDRSKKSVSTMLSIGRASTLLREEEWSCWDRSTLRNFLAQKHVRALSDLSLTRVYS